MGTPLQATLTNLVSDAPYVDDPLGLYQQLCAKRPHSVLLESSEIDSKANLKSLILVDAAATIRCVGRTVTITALSDNGQHVIAVLKQHFLPTLIRQSTATELTLNFPQPDPHLDEDSRLKALSPVTALREVIRLYGPMASESEGLFLGGAFAYDFIASFEHLPEVPDSDNQCPDFQFYLAETLLLIDHQSRQTKLIGSLFSRSTEERLELKVRLELINKQCSQPIASAPAPTGDYQGKVRTNISDERFCEQVQTMKDYIVEGDIFQVVPSRSFYLECPDPLAAYRELKRTNPSPYMFYLKDPEFALFGASPESAIKFCDQTRDVEIYPIAGTRRRGFNPDGSINRDLDGRIELELRQDKKETAEHIMLVDLARNDVARISVPGTRHVAELLKVDRYSHVMHLVSRVVGTLRDDLDALHAYQACMNMGTLVGAPKIRAAELIREVEGLRRGSYGGAVGYLSGNGTMDTCIVIRSAFVKDGMAQVQAGAGVVYDSIPQAEADETRSKAAAVLNAIARAHGSTLETVNRG
jgi:anthranilate synthase component 1